MEKNNADEVTKKMLEDRLAEIMMINEKRHLPNTGAMLYQTQW